MPRLYLVRHAEPAALWGTHPNPGLSDVGESQALLVGGSLGALRGCDLMSSPLARCRETAVPMQALWGQIAAINPAVGEISVPADIGDHRAWLTQIMSSKWSDAHVDDALRAWRNGVVQALLNCQKDTIIFTHFVAINAATSFAMSCEDVTVFKPAHASVTILDATDGRLHLVELGAQSDIKLA